MRLVTLLLTLGLMQACTQVVEKPVPVTVETKVPVVVPCITQDQLPPAPVLATSRATPLDSDCDLVADVLTDRAQLQGYAEKLAALLVGCTAPAGGAGDGR